MFLKNAMTASASTTVTPQSRPSTGETATEEKIYFSVTCNVVSMSYINGLWKVVLGYTNFLPKVTT